MNGMKSVLGHHWTTHSLIVLVLFFGLGGILTLAGGDRVTSMTANRLIGTLVAAVGAATLIIAGFICSSGLSSLTDGADGAAIHPTNALSHASQNAIHDRRRPDVILATAALAGPPFVTDDPEPVELHHWEIYLATQQYHNADGWSGTSPHLEINYGVLPDVQLHIIAPGRLQQGPRPTGPFWLRRHGARGQIPLPPRNGSPAADRHLSARRTAFRQSQRRLGQWQGPGVCPNLAPEKTGRLDDLRRRRLLVQSR